MVPFLQNDVTMNGAPLGDSNGYLYYTVWTLASTVITIMVGAVCDTIGVKAMLDDRRSGSTHLSWIDAAYKQCGCCNSSWIHSTCDWFCHHGSSFKGGNQEVHHNEAIHIGCLVSSIH